MTSKTAPLTLWTTRDTTARALAHRLNAIAAASDDTGSGPAGDWRPLEPAALQAALDRDADATLCLIYTAADQDLARALDAGTSLDAAADRWARDCETLLGLYRKNRARAVVLETGHLHQYFHAGLARLGLNTETHDTAPVPASPTAEATVLRLLARTHLDADPALAGLQDEVTASTTLLSNDDTLSPALPAPAALTALRALQQSQQDALAAQSATLETRDAELTQARHDWDALKAEHAATALNLAEVTAQMEDLQAQLSHSTGARDILLQQSEVMRAELRTLIEQNASQAHALEAARQSETAARAEAERHQQALHAQTEAQAKAKRHADAQAEEIGALAGALAESRAREGTLDAEIDRIMRSYSIRLTAPLRRLSRLLRHKARSGDNV